MNFKNVFYNLRKENNLSQLDIANLTGFAKNTICAWEKVRAQPNLETLIKLADYFNCFINYLLSRENEYNIIQTKSELTQPETQILSLFRLLNEQDQNKLIGYANALAF